MSDPPNPAQPPQYAAYPRGQQTYGSVDKLQALSEGYFGLNKVFLLNVVLLLVARGATAMATDPAPAMVALAGSVLLVGLVVGFATFPYNKKIGYGANWSPSGPLTASVLMGLNSAFCCGIIGYIVVQSIAMSEMKKYGVAGGTFGLRKKHVDQLIERLRAVPSVAPANTFDPQPPAV